MVRLSRTILAVAALAAAAVAAARALADRRRDPAAALFGGDDEVDGDAAPTAAARTRRGTPADRGQVVTVALDVDRLRTAGGELHEPVVQYLTFVQSQRSGDDHLMFVRYADLDAMAELEGVDTAGFLERLDQLGVVVSNN